MIGNGWSFIFICGLLSTGTSALFAQTATESAKRFPDNAMKLRESILFKVEPKNLASNPLQDPGVKYPWHAQIVTTIFWIGETPSGNNPVPNRSSAWDSYWARNFGGSDSPLAGARK